MTARASHLITLDVFLAIGLFLYSNTSAIPLYLDDSAVLAQSRFVDLPRLLDQAWSFGRWLVGLTFAYTDYIKELSVSFSLHRLTNILLHVMTAFQAYLIAFLLAAQAKPGMGSGNPKAEAPAPRPRPQAPSPRSVGFLAGLLFLIHPLQTSTVNYLAQRYVLMATFFLFAAFLCYLRGRIQGPRLLLYCASAAFFVFGLFSKQFVLVFPLLILLAEWLIFRRGAKELKKVVLVALLVVLVSVLYLQLHAGINLLELALSEAPHPPLHYAMTETWVITKYLQMLVAPFNLALNHDVRMITTPVDLRFFLGCLTLLTLVAFALAVRKQLGLLTFSILWYLALLAESSTIVPRIDFIYDYRTYPANLGFFIPLAWLLVLLSQRRRVLGWALGVCLVASYGYISYGQNELWTSPPAFFQKELLVYPENAKSWNLLGRELFIQDKLAEAEDAFRNSLRYMDKTNILFTPVLTSLDYYYLGVIEERRGNDKPALEQLKKAVLYSNPLREAHLDIDYLDPRVLLQLARLYKKTGDARMWELVVKRALILFPREALVWKEYQRFLETAPAPPVSPQVVAGLIDLLLRRQPEGLPREVEEAVKTIIIVYLVGGLLLFLTAHYVVIRAEITGQATMSSYFPPRVR